MTATLVDLARAVCEVADEEPDRLHDLEWVPLGESSEWVAVRYFIDGEPSCMWGQAFHRVCTDEACRWVCEEVSVCENVHRLIVLSLLLIGNLPELAVQDWFINAARSQRRQDDHQTWAISAMPMATWLSNWDTTR